MSFYKLYNSQQFYNIGYILYIIFDFCCFCVDTYLKTFIAKILVSHIYQFEKSQKDKTNY